MRVDAGVEIWVVGAAGPEFVNAFAEDESFYESLCGGNAG